MSEDDENKLDKTSVVDGDTLKLRLDEVKKLPPAVVMLMGPQGLMGKQWLVERSEIIIGRDPTADIFVDEKSISKRHAKLVLDGTQVNIVDLQSTNGTEVAGRKVPANKPISLQNDVKIKLGSVIFKFLSSGNIESVSLGASNDRGNIDSLTQILNKAALTQAMEESFRKARLAETNLSMVVFDLDHFKKVNDTYGHQAGDYVLREVANVVKNGLIRASDAFGRYGGEEFVVVLFGSNLQRACDIAERIRSTVEKHSFVFSGTKIAVTVSVGVAALEPAMPNYEALFEKADKAAYASKHAGRNRVSTV